MSIIGTVESAAVDVVPGGGYVKLALKLAPYLAIALLIGAVLWLRGSVKDANAAKDKALVERNQYKAVNEANAKTIAALSQRQTDNDKIAQAVAAVAAANNVRTETTRQALRNAQNEPSVRNWASEPVPISVQHALKPAN